MDNKESKLLIFDFDGTIVNSKAVYYSAIEKHLAHLGLNKDEADKTIDIGLSINETLKKIGVSALLRWWEKREIMKNVLEGVNKVKKCKDAEHIKNLPGKKILVSNSLDEFIIPVLKHLRIKGEFSEIYGADDFDNKAEFISEYIKNNINKKGVYYIGDRVADVKLARKVGIKSIIISNKCSWSPRKEILKEKPDFIIFDLDSIKNII